MWQFEEVLGPGVGLRAHRIYLKLDLAQPTPEDWLCSGNMLCFRGPLFIEERCYFQGWNLSIQEWPKDIELRVAVEHPGGCPQANKQMACFLSERSRYNIIKKQLVTPPPSSLCGVGLLQGSHSFLWRSQGSSWGGALVSYCVFLGSGFITATPSGPKALWVQSHLRPRRNMGR